MRHSSISLLCILVALLVTACSSGLNAPAGTGTATGAASSAPLPDGAYKAQITPVNPPQTLKAGEQASLTVKVKNIGNGTWPAQGQGPKYKVDLGNHWLDKKGAEVVGDDGRAPLPHDLKAGEEVELILKVKVPKTPGDYDLELDMVHEDVTWFKNHKSPTTKVSIKVQ